LRITKLELNNFGPYRGKVELDFETPTGKGLWIVEGANGAGKTSIFNAIKWCLYGWDVDPDKLRLPTTKDAWGFIYGTNFEEGKGIPPEPFMHVYMWLEASGAEGTDRYLIKRLVRPSGSNARNHTQIEVKLDVTKNGTPSDSPREELETLLPEAASQFFMFHGEKIRDMSQKHLDETHEAIQLILEAETFRRGQADLEHIAKQIDGELDQQRAKSSGLTALLDDKKETQERIDQFVKLQEQDRLDLVKLLADLKDTEEKLATSEGSQRIMGELDQLKLRRDEKQEELDNLNEGRSEYVDDLSTKLILPKLKRILETKEEKQKRIDEVKTKIAEINGRKQLTVSIKELQTCICGRPMTPKEFTHLHGEEQRLSQEIARLERGLEPEDPTYFEVRDTIKEIESSKLDFVKYEKGIRELELKIDELNTQIEGKEKDLAGIAVDKIKELNTRRIQLTDQKGRMEQRMSDRRHDIETERSHLDDVTARIKSIEGYDAIRDNLEKQFKLATNSAKAFEFVLSKLSESRREAVEQFSTEIFRKLTNKPEEYDKIHIDSVYDIYVIDRSGNLLKRESLSTGEREVVAMSFIFGLMKASEKNAPLVLDTFFGNIDEAHYTNMVKSLPVLADQVVLILTDVEFKNLRERASSNFFDDLMGTWQVIRDQKNRSSSIAPIKEVLAQ
jgi:DNA sulfur modification protein DndD